MNLPELFEILTGICLLYGFGIKAAISARDKEEYHERPRKEI